MWASRGYSLYRSDDDGDSFEMVARFNPGLPYAAAASFRLSTRLLRAGFHSLRVLDSGEAVAVVKNGIVHLEPGARDFVLRCGFRNGSRPLSLCATPGGHLFFGEYWGNPDRREVHIYGSSDGGRSWEVVHTFPSATIRHVHGVHYDPFRQGCWVLTGDSDSESRIYFADPELAQLELVASGSQQCRAVTVIPRHDGLVVPMDSEDSQNYIQWLDPASGRLEPLAAVPGTVFYSASAGDSVLLSTVVEPSEVNHSREATIWASADGQSWSQIYSQRKDALSPIYFQYGTFLLAPSQGTSPFAFASGQAVAGDDQRLLRIGPVGDSGSAEEAGA
ncbi:MAG: hypothetical protein AAF184_14025 [Pseudomonadota bacterium]